MTDLLSFADNNRIVAQDLWEAVKGNENELISEAADVLFHFLVMLKSRNIKFADVMTKLENRTKKSGLIEKKDRS